MSFWSDVTGASGARAAQSAAGKQAQAAKKMKKQAKSYKKDALADVDRTIPQATGAISAGEAQALQYRGQAGEALTDAEQRALAEYRAAEGQAQGFIQTGQDQAIGALDQGAGQAIGAIGQGREGSLNTLLSGPQSALGAIDQATSEAQGYFSPYAEAGTGAVREISDLQGLNGPEAQEAARSRFQTDPGYQFRVSEALGAVDRSATARGGLYSGGTLKALQDRASNLASDEYGNYYNRTAGIASQGAQVAGQQANLAAGAGQSRANIYGRAADVYGNTAGQEADIYGNAGTNRANVYRGASGDAAQIAGQAAGARSNLINNFGTNRANILAGSGDTVMGARTNIANTLLGGLNARTGIRGTALDAQTNALAGIGNAQAAGIVGAANARAAGANNLLAMGGAAASAATSPISKTSLVGRAFF